MSDRKKTLDVVDSTCAENAEDTRHFGDPETWELVCKAWNKKEDWMKSTKRMRVIGGWVYQMSTQQGNNIAETSVFVPGFHDVK